MYIEDPLLIGEPAVYTGYVQLFIRDSVPFTLGSILPVLAAESLPSSEVPMGVLFVFGDVPYPELIEGFTIGSAGSCKD